MYIASVFSQLERETIAERIRDNMWSSPKPAAGSGGNADRLRFGGGRNHHAAARCAALQAQHRPHEAKLVELIFRKSWRRAPSPKPKPIFPNGYVTKNNHPFSRFAVKSLLENPVYMRRF
jgi:site-specific DNA recombinase